MQATATSPVQAEILEAGLLDSGFNCVIQLPTGAGKTWLAEQAIQSCIDRGKRALYLSPLRALAAELSDNWQEKFKHARVGALTGDSGVRSSRMSLVRTSNVLVMTPEKFDSCTRRWRSNWEWIAELGLVVVDEFHLLGDSSRGARLEGTLSRARRLNPFAQLLCLSATLGNRPELASWLDAAEFASDERPIPLDWRVTRFRRAAEKAEIAAREVLRCVEAGGQSIIFVQSRRRAEELAGALRNSGYRTAFHHAGLDRDQRTHVETSFREREINVLVATGTLEMGLNLPARQVVLFDLQGYDGREFRPLSVNSVWQRAGRAGRRGLDERGEVVLLAPAWQSVEPYLRGEFEPIRSQLACRRELEEQVLVEIASGLARTRAQVERVFRATLGRHQGVLADVDETIDSMIDAQMLIEGDSTQGVDVLKPTRIGRIAVRQMISPSTVKQLAAALESELADQLTVFDLLFLCALMVEAEPVLSADFEELQQVSHALSEEKSSLISGRLLSALEDIGVSTSPKRTLAALKMALVARAWTRTGDALASAEGFGCFPFEVRRLNESLVRLLTAAAAIAKPARPVTDSDTGENKNHPVNGEPLVADRLSALCAMVQAGIDEQSVTLTFVKGIGASNARRMSAGGIADLEALAESDPEELTALGGISSPRAKDWIDSANDLIKRTSSLALNEWGRNAQASAVEDYEGVDPYRLGRARDLQVRIKGSSSYRVTGGLDPHTVAFPPEGSPTCDCADFTKGNECKHILAVRLKHGDAKLAELVERLAEAGKSQDRLDLFALWYSRS